MMNEKQLEKYEEILEWLNEFPNIHLKSLIYIGTTEPLKWYCDLCPDQGEYPQSWTGMRTNKHKCPSCRKKFLREGVVPKIEKWCKENNVEMPEEKYTKQDKTMKWKCLHCTKPIDKTWNQIHNPSNCICPCRKRTEHQLEMLNYIREKCKEFHLKLLNEDYEDNQKIMRWICLLCGHDFSKSWEELGRERTVKCVNCRSKNTTFQMEKARQLAYRHRCTLLTKPEEYVDYNNPMKWRCENHNGKIIERSIHLIEKYDFICRSCHGGIDTKRLTLEQIETHCQSVQIRLNGEFIYENNRQKLPVKCNICDKTFEATIQSMSQGTGCVDCGRKRAADYNRDSIDSVLTIVMFRGGNIQEKNQVKYVNYRTSYLVDCGKGHQWTTNLERLKRGHWCKFCVPHKFDIEEVREYLANMGWILESNIYINGLTRIKMRCSVGHSLYKPFSLVKNGRKCMECYNLRRGDGLRLSNESYHDAALEKGYMCLEIPNNVHEHALWQCPKKHEWSTSYSNFVHNDTYCPECVRHQKQSRAERTLYKCLDELDLSCGYEPQKKFPNLRNRAQLSLDTFLQPDGVKIAYETDGRQHYEPVVYWGDVEAFIRQHENDRIKERYCFENGISLIRIKYDQKTPEEIEKCVIMGMIRAMEAAEEGKVVIDRIVLPEASQKIISDALFKGDEDLLT